MSDYTPTTQDVREAWLTAEYEERDSTTSNDELRAEFDRWLALIIEGAEQRGAVKSGRAMLEQAVLDMDTEFGAHL